MYESTTPDLTLYRAVHVALRDGAHRLATAATVCDPRDPRRLHAIARYWKGYAGEVVSHHTVEDDFFFPALAARVPVAAELVARTDAEHHRLDWLMERAGHAASRFAAGRDDGAFASVLTDLADLMQRHLDFEDADILPLFERHFTGSEYHELDQRAMKSLPLSRQTAFAVAFVAASMEPEVRAAVLAAAPMPFRVMYRATRRSHACLAAAAFGSSQGRALPRTEVA